MIAGRLGDRDTPSVLAVPVRKDSAMAASLGRRPGVPADRLRGDVIGAGAPG